MKNIKHKFLLYYFIFTACISTCRAEVKINSTENDVSNAKSTNGENTSTYESKSQEYADYLNSVKSEIKCEESRYYSDINTIEKKIRYLQNQIKILKEKKESVKKCLSKECKEHLTKKQEMNKNLKKYYSKQKKEYQKKIKNLDQLYLSK